MFGDDEDPRLEMMKTPLSAAMSLIATTSRVLVVDSYWWTSDCFMYAEPEICGAGCSGYGSCTPVRQVFVVANPPSLSQLFVDSVFDEDSR